MASIGPRSWRGTNTVVSFWALQAGGRPATFFSLGRATSQAQETESSQLVRSLLLTKKSKVKALSVELPVS